MNERRVPVFIAGLPFKGLHDHLVAIANDGTMWEATRIEGEFDEWEEIRRLPQDDDE